MAPGPGGAGSFSSSRLLARKRSTSSRMLCAWRAMARARSSSFPLSDTICRRVSFFLDSRASRRPRSSSMAAAEATNSPRRRSKCRRVSARARTSPRRRPARSSMRGTAALRRMALRTMSAAPSGWTINASGGRRASLSKAIRTRANCPWLRSRFRTFASSSRRRRSSPASRSETFASWPWRAAAAATSCRWRAPTSSCNASAWRSRARCFSRSFSSLRSTPSRRLLASPFSDAPHPGGAANKRAAATRKPGK